LRGPKLLLQLARASFRRAGTPTINASEGIASLEQVDLNGYPQWVLLRGRNKSKPLLLYVHGGPGSAEMALAHRSMPLLEEHFVCVNWDQRGAGKSFAPGPDPRTMKISRFVDDAIALIELLRARFQQDKVYLVGHSWGTVLAMKVAAARPDLLHALVALSQVVDMQRGEEISYRFVLDRARASGNAKAVRALEKTGAPPYADGDLFIQRRWLSEYHGDLHTLSMLDFLSIMLDAPEYDLGDFIRFFRGAKWTNALVWNELMTVNFLREVPSLSVPVTFFLGRHDRTAPPELAVELHDAIEAPMKEIVWFEGSAHMANIEEPEKFQRELIAIARSAGPGAAGSS
jgi:pimeloyl-ACP methyl ester carboxylesterase